MNPFLDVSLRSLAVYLFMILGLRIFGKNQLSQLNAGDVILLLLISNAVQNAMVGPDTSLQGGLVAATVLFLANFGLKKLMFRSKSLQHLVEDEPEILVRDGIVDLVKLKHAEITTDELLETIREHGVEDLKHVKLAVLEVDGNVSVISIDQNNQTNFSRHKRKFPRKAHRI
ncbi:DUF421 domain-containing protein [Chryseobacterium koreense]|uniref:Membrane protein n=1 Tax=Chryseobacterium koreense CCUG 49689 TaxID=1304281 RepID=A0A0J7J1W6_9FLAO|nr:YetF domain-containing protein [Chryseobacterium koreense]KMQ72398.1 membrane protein [Chryseobacterium koreense CCUG 49689]MBB5333516.1 uncharacterized membrane protein YcaP (DUF421 family) [Chryseobacterium koreense]